MQEIKSLEGVYLLLGLVLWLIIFLVIRWTVNKTFISEKRIQPKTNNFSDVFFKELQIFYHIEESESNLILRTDKIEDLITHGKILIEIRNKDGPITVKITYQRRIKLIGYLIILIGIAFCFIGALVPVLIVQGTKKRALQQVDKIFSISNSL
jgi:cellulose biosynthesis protein BcsQ